MSSPGADDDTFSSISNNTQYILPSKLDLYLIGSSNQNQLFKSYVEIIKQQKDDLPLKEQIENVWRTQAILVLAHIFEVIDSLNIIVDPSISHEIDGVEYKKPFLVLSRPNKDSKIENQTSSISSSEQPCPSSLYCKEVIVDTSIMICEHFYKYYIFTHQKEARNLRVARPVSTLDGTSESDTRLEIQPKDCNTLVRKLRGARKQKIGITSMVDHVIHKTSDQIFLMVKSTLKSENPHSDPSIVWIPSDIVILCRKLRLGPYHGGKSLTILDFVTMVYIKPYLETLIKFEKLTEFGATLSNLLEWFDRIQRISEWKKATGVIGANLGFSSVKPELKQFEVGDLVDVESKLPGKLNVRDFKQLQDVVRAPRCDWITNKKRNHHLVRTPYEDMIEKLKQSKIEIPDHTFKPTDRLDLGISSTQVPWTSLPAQLDPAFGSLTPNRAERKRQQISNIIHYVSRILNDGQHIVDFCGGGGHISLVLAWLFPKVKVTLLDRNEVSLAIAQKRKQELGLQNMSIVCSDVQLWSPNEPFHIGVAIHACGSLSDIIMEKCIQQNANYVMAPCCFGSLQNCDSSVIRLPRSQAFANAGVTIEDYMSLASMADVNTSGVSLESTQYQNGKKAMAIIDHDRNLRATESEYHTFQFTMRPPTCTPKNEIICGISKCRIEDLEVDAEIKEGKIPPIIFEQNNPKLTVTTAEN